MTNTVLIKRSGTANSVPTAGQLANGEIAINYADGNLFFKDSGNIVRVLASTQFVSVTGNIDGGNVNVVGNVTGGNLDVTNDVVSNQLLAANLSLSGNVLSIINSTSNITTTGNVSSNYFIGNGSQLTGITVGAGSQILNGNSNVSVAANSNVTISVAGVSNVAVFDTTGEYVTGTISATGNITGSYFIGNGSALTGITAGTTTFSNTAPVSPAVGDVWIQANTAIQYIYFNDNTSNQWAEMEAYQSFSGGGGSVTGSNTQIQFNDGGSAGASANLTFNSATNTLSTTIITATGNITGSYFIGNGSQLTGVSGGGFAWAIANSNITLSANNGYFVDTTGGAKTMTLPASATIGDTVRINDLAGTFSSNNLTVARNGGNIQGVAQDLVVSVDQSSFGLVYSNGTYGWKLLEL